MDGPHEFTSVLFPGNVTSSEPTQYFTIPGNLTKMDATQTGVTVWLSVSTLWPRWSTSEAQIGENVQLFIFAEVTLTKGLDFQMTKYIRELLITTTLWFFIRKRCQWVLRKLYCSVGKVPSTYSANSCVETPMIINCFRPCSAGSWPWQSWDLFVWCIYGGVCAVPRQRFWAPDLMVWAAFCSGPQWMTSTRSWCNQRVCADHVGPALALCPTNTTGNAEGRVI